MDLALMRLSRGERAAVALAVAFAAAAIVRSLQLAGAWIPALDDAFIHAAFARRLAEHLDWGMSAASHVGESSPGFALLLSLAELGPLHFAPQLALLLGYAAYCALPVLAARLLSDHVAAALPAAFLCAMGGPLLFHAQSGMETLPYLALGCAALLALRDGATRRAGLLAAAASWLRLDAWTLWLALGIGLYERRRGEGCGPRSASSSVLRSYLPGILLACGAALWLAVAAGDFPPATLAGRRWLAGLDPQWEPAAIGVGSVRLLRRWMTALGAQYGFGSLGALVAGDATWLTILRSLWKLGAVGMLSLGAWRIVRPAPAQKRDLALRLFAVWGLATLLQYCVLLPARGHAGRYQPQILLGYLLLIAVALPWLWSRRWLRPACSLMLAGVLAGGVDSVRLSGAAAAHLARVHGRAAREIPVRDDQLVAVFDVGWWAYLREDPWFDVSGLGEEEFAEWMQRRELPRVLARRGATHVLLPLTENDGPGSLRDRLGLAESDGVRLLEERSWESSDRDWGQAFQLSGNAARRLVLYRIQS